MVRTYEGVCVCVYVQEHGHAAKAEKNTFSSTVSLSCTEGRRESERESERVGCKILADVVSEIAAWSCKARAQLCSLWVGSDEMSLGLMLQFTAVEGTTPWRGDDTSLEPQTDSFLGSGVDNQLTHCPSFLCEPAVSSSWLSGFLNTVLLMLILKKKLYKTNFSCTPAERTSRGFVS